jgi:hypothetical protein
MAMEGLLRRRAAVDLRAASRLSASRAHGALDRGHRYITDLVVEPVPAVATGYHGFAPAVVCG